MREKTEACDLDRSAMEKTIERILDRSSRLAAKQPEQTQRSVDLFLASDSDSENRWENYL